MAYMASIEEQFEFMQHKLANNPNFLHPETQAQQPATGLDPVIGQGPGGVAQRWPTHWGKPDCQAFDFHSFVTLLGGEYFFAPSLSFLASL